MKVLADVHISNRLLPSLSLKAKARPSRTHVSIGRKSVAKDGAIYLMLSTAQNRNGTFYKIAGNILHVHRKFVDEGKATICFAEPQHDIIISKADSSNLKSLLRVVETVVLGKNVDSLLGGSSGGETERCRVEAAQPCRPLSVLAPPTSKQIAHLKTKLSVTAQQDYPVTRGFPQSLEELQVSYCKLKRVDSRILGLRFLSVLSLSHNGLTTVPAELSQLTRLCSLDLSFNSIDTLPDALFCAPTTSSGCLASSLTSIDVSSNHLHRLPTTICRLSRLTTIRVGHNRLVALPPGFGELVNLRTLDASNNLLQILPASFRRLCLDFLDLYGNRFLGEAAPSCSLLKPLGDQVASLCELSARVVVKRRLKYGADDLPRCLIEYVRSAKQCSACSGPCFESHASCILSMSVRDLVKETFSTLDAAGRSDVPLQVFSCSPLCLRKVMR